MKYKAKIGFCGTPISMSIGEEKEITDEKVAKDLLRNGIIEPISAEPAKPSEPAEPAEPSEPAEPTEPTEPAEPSEPAEPEQTEKPKKATKRRKAAE